MYNNGSWSSYDELYRGVQTAQSNMRSAGVSISMTSLGGDQRKGQSTQDRFCS